MSEDALAVSASGVLATMETAPDAVLREATSAAKALRDVIARKPHPVLMNGEQYLEFEDWQTLGRFYGVTAGEVGEPEFVSLAPGVSGFKATAVALDRIGREISRATAYCLTDEEKWRGRPKYDWLYVLKSGGTSTEDPGKDELVWEDNPKKPGGKRPKKVRVQVGDEAVPMYQLASMAQTRANAKALRNVLSWVAVLAGYRPTPAEEMDGAIPAETVPQVLTPEVVREPGQDDDVPAWVEPPRAAEPVKATAPTSTVGRAPCPQCGKSAGPSKYPKAGKTHYCMSCKATFAAVA
jgi:hypothetical protein